MKWLLPFAHHAIDLFQTLPTIGSHDLLRMASTAWGTWGALPSRLKPPPFYKALSAVKSANWFL